MGVQLNIKDPETVRLARDLADRTGKSVTEAVRVALEGQLAQQEADVQKRIANVLESVRRARGDLTAQERAITSQEAMASVYGADGLPEGS